VSKHPLNLALRFLLELCALAAMSYWGWTQHERPARFFWAIATPLFAAIVWGTFRVPNDPGKAPVPIPGALRLALELLFFGAAVMSLYNAGQVLLSNVLGFLVLAHYLTSYDRIIWLIKGDSPSKPSEPS
jgi:hypothetical protein